MTRPFVFLSHDSADKPQVEFLARRLQAAGIKVWLDKWCMKPGPFAPQIEEALRHTRVVLVLVGPNGASEGWMASELNVALDLEVQGHCTIIPVLLKGSRGIAGLPSFLKTFHVFDLRANADDALQRLIQELDGAEPVGNAGLVDFVPYRGLEPFEHIHADRMFGWDREICELVKALRYKSNIAIVIGNSGAGKSSLVKAGLVPAVISGELDGSREWLWAAMTPAKCPIRSLAQCLVSALREDAPEGFVDTIEETARLRRALDENVDLADVVAHRKRNDGSRKPLLLVIDQLEELFDLDENDASALDERRRFIDLITSAVRLSDDVYIVATLRADSMANALATEGLAEHVRDSSFMVTAPVSVDMLRQIIERPAELAQLSFEAGLVDMIVRQAAGLTNVLPMLQFMLLCLWERRDRTTSAVGLAEYEEIRGIEGAIASCAEWVLKPYSTEQMEGTRRVFRRLVSVQVDGEVYARRVPIDEFPQELQRPIVDRLIDARLLMVDRVGEVRIAHESLVTHWPRLQVWLREEKAGLAELGLLRDAAREWYRRRTEFAKFGIGNYVVQVCRCCSNAAGRYRRARTNVYGCQFFSVALSVGRYCLCFRHCHSFFGWFGIKYLRCYASDATL